MKDYNKKGGLIRILILIIVAILVVSYFNIDLKALSEKPTTQSNFSYVIETGSMVWKEYLSKPAAYFWNNIFIDLLWKSFIDNTNQIKKGEPPINFNATPGNTLPQVNP